MAAFNVRVSILSYHSFDLSRLRLLCFAFPSSYMGFFHLQLFMIRSLVSHSLDTQLLLCISYFLSFLLAYRPVSVYRFWTTDPIFLFLCIVYLFVFAVLYVKEILFLFN